jgi:replication factor A1
MPVKTLNTFSSDWAIKVRVTKKHPLKEWKNDKGSGELFNIDLIDMENTQIQGTFFKAQAKKWFPELTENKIYIVSGGSIKMANKRFTTIPNDYCISFDKDTKFEPAEEDYTISKSGYNFKLISDLNTLQTKSSVDVIGIITDVSPLSQIKLKNGDEKDKRTITIMDNSNTAVDITFWGNSARVPGL